MKVGLLLHAERGIDEVFEEARLADAQGYDSVWLGDHLMSGSGSWRGPDGPDGPLEALTMMTAIGAITERVRLAWSVLNVGFRNPAVLAKSLATLDVITKGRVIVSIGSGSYPPEYLAYNVPVFAHDERSAYMREVVELLDRLWTRPAPEITNYQGKYVQVNDLPFNPAPYQRPRPPIWIGGESATTLKICTDLADGWVTLTRTADKKTSKNLFDTGDKVREVLASPDWPTDRPMEVVAQIKIFVAETHEAALADAKETLGESFGSLDGTLNEDIIGTPEECLARVERMKEAGVTYLRATFATLDQQERVARLLLPLLAETAG